MWLPTRRAGRRFVNFYERGLCRLQWWYATAAVTEPKPTSEP
jgi:hypothetical protein